MDKNTENYVVIEAILGKEMLKRNVQSLLFELMEQDINITDFNSYKRLTKLLDEMDEHNNKLLKKIINHEHN